MDGKEQEAVLQAKAMGVPTVLKDGDRRIPLSVNQILELAALYTTLKGENNTESAMDVAVQQFKELYHVEEGVWVQTEPPPEDAPAQPATEPAKKLAEGRRYKTKPKALFGPGRWLSQTGWVDKSEADCREMVQNYHELKGRVTPTVKIDHDKAQKGADRLGVERDFQGMPNLGIAGDVWWDSAGNQMLGPLVDIPEELAQAIERGEFDKISIEFDDHWWDGVERRYRDNVLKHVSVMGVHWPAYTAQFDRLEIDHTELAEGGGDDVVHYCLSLADAETGNSDDGGGENVDELERLKTRNAELEKENEGLKAAQPDEEKEALLAEIADLKERLELAAKAKDAADEKIAEAELEAKKAVVEGAVKEAMTPDADGNVKMAPGEADIETARLLAADDSRTIKLADGDGNEVEKSEFELGLEALKNRSTVLKLAEKSAADGGDAHPGEERNALPAESADETETREGFGLERDKNTGAWVHPDDTKNEE